MEFNQQLYAKRRRSNAIGLTLSLGAMALGLFVLLWILSVLLSNGFAALDWNMFTQSTPAPGSDGGGLANAIVGSLLMVGFTVLVSTPIGVLAGVLAQIQRHQVKAEYRGGAHQIGQGAFGQRAAAVAAEGFVDGA